VSTPSEQVRPLLRTRQVRQFSDQPVDDADLAALADVARWTGSSRNSQPWRFILIRDTASIREIAAVGMPLTRALSSAMAAIAIVLPEEPSKAISLAYDEGRAAERILIGARMLGLGAGITWIGSDARETVHRILGVAADRRVRTIVAIGHPTEAAQRPKSPPGTARLPREQTVFDERWPQG